MRGILVLGFGMVGVLELIRVVMWEGSRRSLRA